jgi:acid phosphatase (class A)
MRGARAAALLLAALVATSPRAGAAPPRARGGLDASEVIGPPPAPGSDEEKADLAVVLWLQRTRSAEDVARARSEVKIGLEHFAPALAPGFDPARHPGTRALLERLHEEASAAVDAARARYGRPRPFAADAGVEAVVKRDDTPSYPSSHGTRGVLYARMLGELAPARRDALLEVGRRLGYDRVLAGVHYPSDVLAGQRLGAALADGLLADPRFRAELAELRAKEWGG